LKVNKIRYHIGKNSSIAKAVVRPYPVMNMLHDISYISDNISQFFCGYSQYIL
jgi:hypothetical protein